jgi:hypothetical protein
MVGRYDNSIQTRFLAPIDCSKITALLSLMRAGKGIEEEKKGFFCSATKFALKEEKIAAKLFRDEPLNYSRPHSKDKRPKTKLQLLTNKLVEEGNQKKSRVLSH